MLTHSPAKTAFNWLLASGTAQTLTDEIRAISDHNMAIANAKTQNSAKELITDALAEMPKFLGEVSPADLGALVAELMPEL